MNKANGTPAQRLKARIAGLDVDIQETPNGVAWAIYAPDGERLDGDAEGGSLVKVVASVFKALERLAPDAPPAPELPPPLTAAQTDLIVGRVLAVLDARTSGGEA